MKKRLFTLNSMYLPLIIFLFFFSSFTAYSQQADTLWKETWEGNWTNDWYVDGGTWEVGRPTSGPNKAFRGINCAATNLIGDYAEGVRTRLIRSTSFVVPSESISPRLRFYSWQSMNWGPDYGTLQIRQVGGNWVSLAQSYELQSYIWGYTSYDLSAYKGKNVQICFYFESNERVEYGHGHYEVGPGWYIDEVSFITGPVDFSSNENFENGMRDWSTDHGMWEVGRPTSGPNSGHNSLKCAATNLSGDYYDGYNYSLFSPFLKVGSAANNPNLRFWHWFSFNNSDHAEVQIRKSTAMNTWTTVSSEFWGSSSSVWSNFYIDLSSYANQVIQVRFYFESVQRVEYGHTHWEVGPGWYIDDVTFNGCSHLNVSNMVQINSPNGGESWQTGSTQNITWSTSDTGKVKLDYTTDNGTSWVSIVSGISAAAGTYSWTVPNTPSTQCRVRITNENDLRFYSLSDNVFTISQTSDIDTDNGSGTPQEFSLKQNFPNPFNPSTTIQFQIAAEAFVTLKVYTILGNECAVLFEGTKLPGSYQITFEPEKYGLASGTYLLQMNAGSFTAGKKMIFLK